MPIPLSCDCGRSLRVKDEAAGRKVRCPECGAILKVPLPEAPKDVEDAALDILLADAPAEERVRAAERAEAAPPPEETRLRPSPPPPMPRPLPSKEKLPERGKARSASRSRRSERSGGGIAIHPEILAGIGMMVGAAVWFFLGLAANIIYFYPPILFCLGIGAIVRGFTGRE